MPSAPLERLSAGSAGSLKTAPSATEVALTAGNTTHIQLRVGSSKITLRVKIPEGRRRAKVAERRSKRRETRKAVLTLKQQNGRGPRKSLH